MASAQVFAFTLFLVLSAHGSEVVARVKFAQQHFSVKESPQICVDVVNELYNPNTQLANRILVTARIDNTLLGINSPGGLDTSFEVFPNTNTSQLCFIHIDDNKACEPPIVGNVELLSSPVVDIVSPFRAQITINDDDATQASFNKTTYLYNESGVGPSESLPMITICKSNHSIQLMVGEVYHLHAMAEPSLIFSEMSLTANSSQNLTLHFVDDEVALEQLEVVKLELRSVPSPGDKCNNVRIEPHNTTTIYIQDDDYVTMSLRGSEIRTHEDQGHAHVCVELTHVIATPLEFELWPRSGTAQSDLDFSSSKVIGRFDAMSDTLVRCADIPVLKDDLIEEAESFNVSLHLRTNLPPSLAQRLIMNGKQVRVTITDTSSCTHVDLGELKGEREDGYYYISQQKSVCFTCTALAGSPNFATNSFYWSFGEDKLLINETNSKGKVFPNRTLLIVNSSQTFSTENATRLMCVNNSQSLASQTAVLYLGAAPSNVSLSYKNSDTTATMTLTCSYSGSPQPRLEWRRNSLPLPQRGNDSITIHTSRSSFNSLLTVPLKAGEMKYNYSCVVANQFGNSSSSIVITVKVSPTSTPRRLNNSALSTVTPNQITIIVMILLFLLPLMR